MYREFGLLLILLLPVAVLYFSRQDNKLQPTSSKQKKSKKKNKNKANKTDKGTTNSTATVNPPSTTRKEAPLVKPALESTSANLSLNNADKAKPVDSEASSTNPPAATQQPQPEVKTTVDKPSTIAKEVDEHMDLTTRYSRVMRIRTETPDEPLAPVPYEDGWNQVKPSNSQQPRSAQPKDEPLTKKQRENQARAAKKKELKAQADAIQEQRLRQHQRQLEKEKMAAFYSSGAGKHTQWGSKPRTSRDQVTSSKSPSEQPDLDDQLIWD